MSGIFISYRRQDSQGSAGRLADTLKAQFARNQIFRDVEAIEPGVDFVDAIERALASCVVLLALIGPRWLSATDKNGRRRLDDPNDYTRIEIAAALHRNVRVIPVLVDGAVMPDADELPDDLKSLARRQASELSDKRWDFDVRQLVQTIEKIPGIEKRSEASGGGPDEVAEAGQRGAKAWHTQPGIWIGIAVAALVATVLGVSLGGHEDRASAPTRSDAPLAQPSARSETVTRETTPPAAEEPVRTVKRQAEPTLGDVPVRAPASPKYPEITGTWVDSWGNRYSVMRQDNRIAVRMMANSLGRDAEGKGTISGRRIVMDYAFREPSIGYSVGRADVEVSSAGDVIQGTYIENASGTTMPFLLRR